MLQVTATGSPHSIGLHHGQTAKLEIGRSIVFYRNLFQTKSKMDWETVKAFALKYQPFLSQNWPEYVSEMGGIATGAEVSFSDILALNVRTEIAFGAFSDGCTAISWKGNKGEGSFLGQNWDWNVEQAENLISLKIEKSDGLQIQMITEAGIIGKIGLNSNGVGCTLNALKAKGVSFTKLPCHLALRTVMESKSRAEAVDALNRAGIASACNILIADETGGTGVEASSENVVKYEMDERGVLLHTNHFIFEHEGVKEEPDWLLDTRFRLRRIGELADSVKAKWELSADVVQWMLSDEVEDDGVAICRSVGKDGLATLFSIVMDLGKKTAKVSVGQPAHPVEKLVLSF